MSGKSATTLYLLAKKNSLDKNHCFLVITSELYRASRTIKKRLVFFFERIPLVTFDFLIKVIYLPPLWKQSIQKIVKRPVRLGVRTPGFHPGNTGSNPVRAAKTLIIPKRY